MAIINYFAAPESYNSGYFPTVYEAAQAVATPFLIQQKNQAIEGVTVVNGNQIEYNGAIFTATTNYINPGPNYFIPTPAAFGEVWQNGRFPNAIYDPATSTFNATIDCVGFACRVLIAVGAAENDQRSNAYLLFHSQINPQTVHFAVLGIVPTAFEFAVALPVITQGRWSYVSGNVNINAIQSQENKNYSINYNGEPKGGFAAAQTGDIVCFGYIGGASNGHFMVLTEAPKPVSLSLFTGLSGVVANAYQLSVYDSTDRGSSLHFNDSRQNDKDTDSGVGYGQLYLFTDNGDVPVGFIFGPSGNMMEPTHYINPAIQTDKLVVAAISVGRFR